jgi:hypothetical protein
MFHAAVASKESKTTSFIISDPMLTRHGRGHDTERQTTESPTALRNSHRSDSDHDDRIP